MGCGVHGDAEVHGGVGCTEMRGEQRLGVHGGAEVYGVPGVRRCGVHGGAEVYGVPGVRRCGVHDFRGIWRCRVHRHMLEPF